MLRTATTIDTPPPANIESPAAADVHLRLRRPQKPVPYEAVRPLTPAEQRQLLARIVRVYPSPLLRARLHARYVLLRQHFLDEVGQYLPHRGRILDVGCGVGLYGLYFAGAGRARNIDGFDIDEDRVRLARTAARLLGLQNARFRAGSAISLSLDAGYDAAYADGLIHHLHGADVPVFLKGVHEALRPGGVLLIKDVADRPRLKRWFTLALDRSTVGLRDPIDYWPVERLKGLLGRIGFTVHTHAMRDFLPYPHVLYVCRKKSNA